MYRFDCVGAASAVAVSGPRAVGFSGVQIITQSLGLCLDDRARDKPAFARSPSRKRTTPIRHFAIYLSHVLFGLSQKAVAGLFGRDRTTVRYICARIEDLRDNPRIDRMLCALEAATLAFVQVFFSQLIQVQS